MHFPSQDEFLKLTQKGNLIPVYREILGDLDTPVSAYLKLTAQERQSGQPSFSFLLESVEGEEKVARYSFLAKNPELVVRSKDRDLEILRFENGQPKTETITITETPLTHLRDIMSQYRFVGIPGLPPFCGGMVGYLGYDVVRFFERLPNKPQDDLNLPDTLLTLAKTLVIFDHLNHKIKVVSCVHVKDDATEQDKISAYQNALRQMDDLVNEINTGTVAKCPDARHRRVSAEASSSDVAQANEEITPQMGVLQQSHKPSAARMPESVRGATATESVESNFSKSQFLTIVKEAQKKILAGDIIQVVLSQRFQMPLKTEPFNIYRMLRALNPSPYMYYLHFGDIQIVGSSPELLVRCEDGVVETRPIAGTRPRGKDENEDAALAKDLLSDPKEKAEHIMLVDLGRNDLGRVCSLGSIRISEFMTIEKYSHVMHIVSNVRGKLKKGQDAFDVLKATFPAGTVSGAPKIRAMEIIDELENVSRGPYAGCIGYFSFSGNLDSCITIRTIVVHNGQAYIQAGAGIVADSVPEKEYRETINKARAQILAIEAAYKQFSQQFASGKKVFRC